MRRFNMFENGDLIEEILYNHRKIREEITTDVFQN
jgi:hypothetical protein